MFAHIIARSKACGASDEAVFNARNEAHIALALLQLHSSYAKSVNDMSDLEKDLIEKQISNEDVEERVELERILKNGSYKINCDLYRDPYRQVNDALKIALIRAGSPKCDYCNDR